MPTTTVQVMFEADEGNGSWRDDPCDMDEDCHGLSGPVRVQISTEDGLLADEFVGGIDGILGETAALDVTANSFREFTGTLPDADFVDENGDPMVVYNAGVAGTWSWDNGSPNGSFQVYTPAIQPGVIVLGQSVE
jgi:hypothetical protein